MSSLVVRERILAIATRLGVAPQLRGLNRALRRRIRPPLDVVIAARTEGKALFERLRGEIAKQGIPAFFGGGGKHGDARLHLRDIDAPRLHALLRSLDRAPGKLRFKIGDEARPIEDLPDNLEESYDLLVEEFACPDVDPKLNFVSVINVDIWRPLVNYSSEALYDAGRPNIHCSRIQKTTLDRFVNEGRDLDQEPTKDVYQPDFEVDVVYTWVDGDDPEWIRRKEARARSLGRTLEAAPRPAASRSLLAERYRNRNELLYSLRSVDQFAPFVRKIWLVTDGQVPAWLKPSSRLAVVDHKEIFRRKDMLPSFNSSAIETQLHHIDGLAEHFIYFNDDVFLGNQCSIGDFFTECGYLRYIASSQRVNEHDVDSEREEYLVADRNANLILKRDLGVVGRVVMQHVPHPTRRSLLFDLEKRFQAEFDACASQPFRSVKDLRPISFMQYPYAVSLGKAVSGVLSHRYLALWKENIDVQLDGVRYNRRWKTFCINDVGVRPEREQWVNDAVREFLKAYFPVKSQFEI